MGRWSLALLLCGLSACGKTIPNNPTIATELCGDMQSNLRLDQVAPPKSVYAKLRSQKIALKAEKLTLTDKKFDLNADQVEARLFFMNLAKDTPYNMVVRPTVAGKISLQLSNTTFLDALDIIKKTYGYDFRKNGNTIEVLPATLQTRTFVINYLDLNRSSNSSIFVRSGGTKTDTGSSSSTTTTGGSSTSTTSSTSSPAGSNSNNSAASSDVNSQITTTSNTNFWTELKNTVDSIVGTGDNRKVAVSPLAGILVVQAMPDELTRVEEYLRTAELILNKQVILEAKILEVQLGDSYKAGIDWQFLSGRFRLQQGDGGMFLENNSNEISNSFTDFSTSNSAQPVRLTPGKTFGGFPSQGGDLNETLGGIVTLSFAYKNLAAFVEALEGQGKVQVLSSPRVSTLNHQKALIKVGKDQYFVTNVSSTTTTGGSTTSSTPNVTFDPFFSGISLDVIPHIHQDDLVTLHVHPSVSTVTTLNTSVTVPSSTGTNAVTSSYPLALSNVRESDTIVQARSGQVIVLGGLMQDTGVEERVGIPLLKDIPGFGRLFRQDRKKTLKSELVILLRPIVADVNSKVWNKALDESMKNFEYLDVTEPFCMTPCGPCRDDSCRSQCEKD